MKKPVAEHMRAYRDEGYSPPDGVLRPLADEHALNAACRRLFETEDGRVVLSWLHRITTHRLSAMDAGEAELRSLNAQRIIVRIIEERIEHGRHGRPGTGSSTAHV